ncbi:MaoC domain protein dehydratase [Syntrophobotulus glycolicus DSM 8271]|uniref:MaoC domain protein dehydratase n=1 Tax=Syntrophobotulus glycolicus (strain DSM 8271 / FlGlyR) TaxID=645991 RepID=F0SU68_SYNGF|nr:MaoC family dehydratase N-terminal domain-containing protein [Syntrophobotulus glycolicus]ADY55451.1 MaoC domain protein dehydratase [Syntrophobotulus glycolicus DSM 8271]
MAKKNVEIGKATVAVSYEVERGKIKEFATALGDSNPVYFSREEARKQGYRDIIAAPTFGLPVKRWGSGVSDYGEYCKMLDIDPQMVVHGEQEFLYFGEINPGDVLTGQEYLTDLIEKDTMYLLVCETKFYNQDGAHVLTSRFTQIERKRKGVS